MRRLGSFGEAVACREVQSLVDWEIMREIDSFQVGARSRGNDVVGCEPAVKSARSKMRVKYVTEQDW